MSRTINLIVGPWKFDVLETGIFALEASLLGLLVLRTSNSNQTSPGQLSADNFLTETFYSLFSNSP